MIDCVVYTNAKVICSAHSARFRILIELRLSETVGTHTLLIFSDFTRFSRSRVNRNSRLFHFEQCIQEMRATYTMLAEKSRA